MDVATANTVNNYFRRANISEETQVASTNVEDNPFKLLEENINERESRGEVDGDFTVDDYLHIDFEVLVQAKQVLSQIEKFWIPVLSTIMLRKNRRQICSYSKFRLFEVNSRPSENKDILKQRLCLNYYD